MSQDLTQRLHDYFAENPDLGVVSAYLYGSHAEGRAHRESDVDVGVLLDWDVHPDKKERFDLRVRLTAEVMHALGENRVDLVVLNDVSPELGRKVVRDGLRVFRADEETDKAYVRDVQLRAADLVPWLERMRKRKLEVLRR